MITAVALVLAAGCSSRGAAAGAGAPRLEKTDLNVAVVPALDSAGFFVALYGGLFKAQGLNVHFTPATSSETVIADQVKGQFDITLGNYVSYIQAQQRRAADLYVFAEASVMGPATQGIYTMPDSKVTDLSDLAGKTIAINAPKNILYLLAASVLAEHGIKPGLVQFASVPFPKMTAALQSGAVGAALLPEPFASGAEEAQGVVPLADLNQGATTAFPIAGYVVTKKWAARYPRTLAAFYTAIEQGQQLADTSRSDVEEAMMDTRPVRRVQADRGRPSPGQLSVQPRPGRQRGQDTAPARGERDAAVHRVPQVQHRHHAHAPHLTRGRAGALSTIQAGEDGEGVTPGPFGIKVLGIADPVRPGS
jgi:NitT/TauT family transport system substrate-binding protein